MPITQRMPDFSGVAAGAVATAQLPVGLTYRSLAIRYQRGGVNATKAQIQSDILAVVLRIDGEEKIRLTGSELLAIFEYNKNVFQAGVVPLVFARNDLRTANGEDATAYGTADVSSMQVEVEIAGAATSPSLKLFAEQSAPAPLGQHLTIRPYSRTASATGEIEEANLPKGTADKPRALSAIHITTANIDRFELTINNNKAMDEDVETATFLDGLKGRDKVWQSGFTHINPLRTNRLADAIPVNVQDLRLKTNHTSTGSYKYLVENVEVHRSSR